MTVKKIAFLGVFTTLALILSYVESLVPIFIGIPGVKLGLANLVTVFVIYRYTIKDAVIVSALRVLIAGFLFGNLMSIIFSMTGTIFSIGIMSILKKLDIFSLITVSVSGACMHNVGQILIALFVVHTSRLIYYLPILLISGVITGLLIGVSSKLLLEYIPYEEKIRE